MPNNSHCTISFLCWSGYEMLLLDKTSCQWYQTCLFNARNQWGRKTMGVKANLDSRYNGHRRQCAACEGCSVTPQWPDEATHKLKCGMSLSEWTWSIHLFWGRQGDCLQELSGSWQSVQLTWQERSWNGLVRPGYVPHRCWLSVCRPRTFMGSKVRMTGNCYLTKLTNVVATLAD